jgi:hypothetical protein
VMGTVPTMSMLDLDPYPYPYPYLYHFPDGDDRHGGWPNQAGQSILSVSVCVTVTLGVSRSR